MDTTCESASPGSPSLDRDELVTVIQNRSDFEGFVILSVARRGRKRGVRLPRGVRGRGFSMMLAPALSYRACRIFGEVMRDIFAAIEIGPLIVLVRRAVEPGLRLEPLLTINLVSIPQRRQPSWTFSF